MSSSSILALGRARLASHARLFSSTELVIAASLLRQQGLPESLLLHHGVTSADLSDPSRRLSLHQATEIFRLAHGLSGQDLSIAVGRQLHLSTFGLAGFALLSCPTLMDAVRRAQAYWPLFNLKHHLDISEDNGVVRLVLTDRFDMDADQTGIFATLESAKLITLFHDLAGPQGDPLRIGMPSACAAPWAQVVAADRCFIDMPASVMHAALPQANPAVHRNIIAMCDRTIDDLFQESPLVRRIKAQLGRLEDGVPALPEIAVTLCMSERTLRRRLQESGTSYYRLLDEVRMEMAERYLRDESVTTDLIAERLGYAEVTNFRHAFKRWTGSSPRNFSLQIQA